MKIDSTQEGSIPLVLHELIHYILCDMGVARRFDDKLEEAVTSSLAELAWHYVDADHRRLKWWRENLALKLTGPATSTSVPTSPSISSSPDSTQSAPQTTDTMSSVTRE